MLKIKTIIDLENNLILLYVLFLIVQEVIEVSDTKIKIKILL